MKLILIICILINILQAKDKDFYYNFIDSNGKQISKNTIDSIQEGLDYLEYIKTLVERGNLKEAFEHIRWFKDKNKSKILYSDIMILYSTLASQSKSKKLLMDTANELENAIVNSLIKQQDMLQAYLSMVNLKLGINRPQEAQYFANIIINGFDDDISKAYGAVALSKVYTYKKEDENAKQVLLNYISKTTNKFSLTIAGDELFEIYIKEGEIDDAKEMIKRIFKLNLDFYSNNSLLSIKKVDTLIKLRMFDESIELLNSIIKNSKSNTITEEALYKLAGIYLNPNSEKHFSLDKSKYIYGEIIKNFINGNHSIQSEMYFDEIQMRQNIVTTDYITNKYKDSTQMQEKAIMQELINNYTNKKYEKIFKLEKVYKRIPKDIANRFHYNDIDEIINNSYLEYVRHNLVENNCKALDIVYNGLTIEQIKEITSKEYERDSLINCLVENPNLKVYQKLKTIFDDTNNPNIYFSLEKIAFLLNLINDAYDISLKLEALNNTTILQEEFLKKYEIVKLKNSPKILYKFLQFLDKNQGLAIFNEDKPMIIDVYNDYYGFLLIEKPNQAYNTLEKLNEMQNKFKAYIYSPSVEIDLAKNSKNEKNLEEAVIYLLEGIDHAIKVTPSQFARIYYELSSLYEELNDKENSDVYLKKCKELVGAPQDDLYKNMCDKK